MVVKETIWFLRSFQEDGVAMADDVKSRVNSCHEWWKTEAEKYYEAMKWYKKEIEDWETEVIHYTMTR